MRPQYPAVPTSYTVAEVCRLLSVPLSTWRDWRKQDVAPRTTVLPGWKRARVLREDLRRWEHWRDYDRGLTGDTVRRRPLTPEEAARRLTPQQFQRRLEDMRSDFARFAETEEMEG